MVFNVTADWKRWSQYNLGHFSWGYFACGTVAWLTVAFNILVYGRKSAARRGFSRHYTILAAWANTIWLYWVIHCSLGPFFDYLNNVHVVDLLFTPVLAIGFRYFLEVWDSNKFTSSDDVHDGGHHSEMSTQVQPGSSTISA